MVFFSAKISASDAQILTVIGQGEPDPTETEIQTTPALFTFVDSANGREMNVSTSGIGIGNNVLEGNTTSGINSVNGSTDDFTATVTDGDGDTATNSFSADLYANELSGDFDFVLTGTASEQDSFNIDLSSDLNTNLIAAGFEVGSDLLVLLGLTPHEVTIGSSGADTIVSIEETDGGEVTTVTVVWVTLTSDDIVLGP